MAQPLPTLLLLLLLLLCRQPLPGLCMAERRQLTIAIFLPARQHGVPGISLEAAQPVVDVALDRSRQAGLLPANLRLRILANDSQCDYKYAPVIALLLLKEVDVLLGPFCTFCLAAVARYNRYYLYRKPILTSGGAANLEDKEEYYNMVRLGPRNDQLVQMLLAIFRHYGWLPREQQNLLVIHVPDDDNEFHKQKDETRVTFSRLLSTSIEKSFFHAHRYIVRGLPYSSGNAHFQSEVFRVMRTEVRLVVLCADPDTVREVMIKAYQLGFINGEYVFFNIDLFSSESLTSRPWYRKSDPPERNAAAAIAYRALMTITLRKPNSTEYRRFSDRVKSEAKQRYGFEYPEEEVNSFVGAFHDAVLLYALAINDTLATHGVAGISNGSLITEKMKNRTFEGITGTVSINANGDRNADYSLLDMDKDTQNFTVVAHYYGNTQRYELVKGREIDWYNADNTPPPDIPKCGYDFSRCRKDFSQIAIYAVVVLLVLILVLTVLILVIYRKLRLESELHAMNWRIAWHELEPTERLAARRRSMASQSSRARADSVVRLQAVANHHAGGGGGGPRRQAAGEAETAVGMGPDPNDESQPLNSETRQQQQQLQQHDAASSQDSVETIAGVPLSQIPVNQLFAKTAYYKGTLVALKQIYLRNKRLELNNKILMEIKRVKDLASDNIVRFIGACLESPNECLVTEYCPKGSLQDILENDNLNLDWMFKFSLMLDICRGMIYLHHSFGPHGNLKSSNCLVDSRFSLKIADFGLHSLRGGSKECKERDDSDYSSYRSEGSVGYAGL